MASEEQKTWLLHVYGDGSPTTVCNIGVANLCSAAKYEHHVEVVPENDMMHWKWSTESLHEKVEELEEKVKRYADRLLEQTELQGMLPVMDAANRYYYATWFRRSEPEAIKEAKLHFDYEMRTWRVRNPAALARLGKDNL